MKKTLFLSAILATALCSSAFAEYSWTTTGGTIAPAKDGAAITYGSVIDVTTATTETISGDVKVKSTGDNMSVDLKDADSIYISEGRVHMQDADAQKLGDAAVFVKGGTLWVRCAEVSNDLYIGSSTYTNGNENCNKSALRLQRAGGSITLSGTITLGEDARINATQNTTANITGDIEGAGKALSLTVYYNTASRFNLSGTNTLGTLNIAETLIGNGPQRADVTISGGTTTTDRLTLGLASDATLTVANSATLTVKNGATLAKAITNNGTLNLAGNVVISGVNATADSVVYFGDTAASTELNGNGYLINGTRKYQLITNTGTLNASTATFSDADMSGGTCDANGLVTISKEGGTASGTYYVNTGALDYTADSAAASDATTGIKVTKANTVITIADDATLNASKLDAQAATKLSGSGLYVAGSAQTMGTNISLSADWTGTVQLKGALDGNVNFYKTAANANSTIEMKGVTGWFYDWYTTRNNLSANIKLTDDGTTLAWVNGAFGSPDPTAKHTGTWSGTGSFRTDINNDRQMHYTYSGNIENWTGKFIYGGKGDGSKSNLTFTENATAVNIAIEKAQGSKGTFTVIADADVTFSKDITASALTINDGKTVDLGTGTLTLGSMTLGNGATVKFHSDADWTESEVALTTGNGHGHVGISKTLGYTVTDNGATVTVDGLAATLNEGVLSSTTTKESDIYYINNTAAAATVTGTATLNAGTYTMSEELVVGVNNASAEGSSLTINGTTSVTTSDYLEVYHNSTLAIKDTAALTTTAAADNMGLWLHNGSQVNIDSTASLTVQGLTFKGGEITATGDTQIGGTMGTPANATITGSDITVTSGKLRGHHVSGGSVTVNSGTETTIESALSATTALTVNNGSTATFSGNASVASVAGEGSLKLTHDLTVAGNAAIGSLTLSNGADITVNNHNGTLSLTELTVTANGSEMNANLVVNSGTLTFAEGAVLTMGCDVTISGSTVYVTIDSTFDDFMAGLRAGNIDLVVIDGLNSENEVKALTLNGLYVTDSTGAQYTNNELGLKVVENSLTSNGAYCIVVAPEPATATLSLLALAALAARRKRH